MLKPFDAPYIMTARRTAAVRRFLDWYVVIRRRPYSGFHERAELGRPRVPSSNSSGAPRERYSPESLRPSWKMRARHAAPIF